MSNPEADAYLKNLETLVTARTEQLRSAVTAMEKLSEALKPHEPDVVERVREAFDDACKQVSKSHA